MEELAEEAELVIRFAHGKLGRLATWTVFWMYDFAFWRVQKQLRNLEGQGGEFLSGLLLRLFFCFLPLNQILWI